MCTPPHLRRPPRCIGRRGERTGERSEQRDDLNENAMHLNRFEMFPRMVRSLARSSPGARSHTALRSVTNRTRVICVARSLLRRAEREANKEPDYLIISRDIHIGTSKLRLFRSVVVAFSCCVAIYLPFNQYTWQPSCLRRRCNTLIVAASLLVFNSIEFPLALVVIDDDNESAMDDEVLVTDAVVAGAASLYRMNKLVVYAFWMRCFRSRDLMVDVTSILPVARRFSIKLGIEKLTAERMWPSWNSFELRQSNTMSDLVGERSSDCSHSLLTVSTTSCSGILSPF